MKRHEIKTKAVIFDMDGVITNTMPDHFRAWQIVLKEEGIHVSHFDVYSREGQRGFNSVREIFAAHGRKLTQKDAKKILDRKEGIFKKIVKIRFVPGARNFIRHLHRDGFLLALVTGTARHEMMEILPGHIRRHFKLLITGTEVKIGKPDPEPYLLALRRLGLKSSRAVVIENAPFGIQSAKAAGIRCLAIETSLPARYLKEADYIFDSISHMEQKLRFLSCGTVKK